MELHKLSEISVPSLCGRPEKARRWNGETILPRSSEPCRLFNITEARSSRHIHRYSLLIGESVGRGVLIRIDAAHDFHQIDDMAGLGGYKVATRRGMLLTLSTKDRRTHHAMLHVETV